MKIIKIPKSVKELKAMTNNEMARKTIYIPSKICAEIEKAAKSSRTSFSAIVTERLTNNSPLTICEGREICQKLFEIQILLSEGTHDNDLAQKVTALKDQITDTLLEIQEKYLTTGE